MEDYVPDAGDIVWLRHDREPGQTRAPRRTALVVSPATYNVRAGIIVCCSMTSRMKGRPFEVMIQGLPQSVVLADRVGRRDWRARRAIRRGQVSPEELEEVRAKLMGLLSEVELGVAIAPVARRPTPQMPGRTRASAPPTTPGP